MLSCLLGDSNDYSERTVLGLLGIIVGFGTHICSLANCNFLSFVYIDLRSESFVI